MFRFAALQAVILNKAMSLVVVASALPFRMATVPLSAVVAHCRSSSICWPEALSVRGSGPGGQHGSLRKRCIASLPFCWV
jgi:hypothetical protein